ncbi:MAG: DUF2185 domain-containing protein [Sphingomonadales bacterium]|nr:DUF2185 domain-containing protein [Sphingomonadales bacterium]MBD3773189.1 DUF2185 domain-containing protein [Paracoccaceae bacterium]
MSGVELPAGISIADPRPVAARAPYTFFLPHPDELAALAPGDAVKAIFKQQSGETKYDAERMWVAVEEVADGWVTGRLDNEPVDMPRFALGDPVRIPLTHVISTRFAEGRQRPAVPDRRQYWDRCFVDACVVEGRSHVDYLYREEPDMTREGDEYPDSGWRLRGTQDAIDEDEANGDAPLYIALGAVLNKDDRWLPLIDSGYDRHFRWDEASRSYSECC